MKRIRIRLFLYLLCCMLLAACAGENANTFSEDDELVVLPPKEPVTKPDKPPTPTETPLGEGMGMPEGYVYSRLTGLPIRAEADEKRPVAVVVNNLYKALPQSGIAQADLIYEVLAESTITRLVAIFQDFDAEKIGPVRSARDYFVHFALNHDAIFVHHGGSPSGYQRLKDLRIDRLDGMNLEGPYYWRDRSYPAWYTHNAGQRPMEHSSYTSSEKIKAAAERFGFRDTLYEDAPFGFSFYETTPAAVFGSTAEGEVFTPCSTIRVPFSSDYTRVFNYDPATRLYAVSNRDGAHYDAEIQEQLYVSNILIQSVSMRVIPGDEAGRRDVKTVGAGDGWLATGGGYIPVKWQKADHRSPTEWTLNDGSVLRLNTGRTWICVLQDNQSAVFEDE